MTRSTNMEHVEVLRELRDTGDVSDWRAMESALDAAIASLSAQPPAEAQERPEKPAECADGCPPQQVCDHCQWPPGPDAEAQAQGGGEVAMEAWHAAVNDAGELRSNAPDERYARRAANVESWIKANRPAPPSAPVGVSSTEREWLQYAIDHMRDDNEPEDATCADVLEALLNRVESAPVGVEAADIADRLRNIASIMRGFGGTERIDGKAWERVTELADRVDSLAQQPAATLPDVDDDDLTVAYMAGRHDGRKEAQQPAAVDGVMVSRFLEAFRNTDGDEAIDADEKVAHRWLTAALAAQQGGSDNDR